MPAYFRRPAVALAIAAAIATFAGCSAAGPTRATPRDIAPARESRSGVEREVRSAYNEWKGASHRLGGNVRSGIDCSGFVRTIFLEKFDVELPRTTSALSRVGRPIERQRLEPGDLVFFKPHSYPRHVGIYAGRGEFVHVSTKKGVMLSRTTDGYWSKHYWTARRVLD